MVKVTTSDSTGYSGRVMPNFITTTAVRETTVQSDEVTEASAGETLAGIAAELYSKLSLQLWERVSSVLQ